MWVVRFKTGDGAQQVGLFQAYLLMSSLGVALWFGSFTDNPGRWHVIGFLVHTAPLAANLIFWSMITQHGITHAGVAIPSRSCRIGKQPRHISLGRLHDQADVGRVGAVPT